MKKLNLDELELQLPKIHEKNSRILLGGDDYSIFSRDVFQRDNTMCCDPHGGGNGSDQGYEYDDYASYDEGEPDGSYDLDYGQDDNYQDVDDYSYDQDGDVGNSGSNGGNGSTISEAAILANFPPSFFDGSDPQNYLFNMSLGNENFTNQLMTILQSNSVINTDLAGYFNNQYVQMTFDVADIDSPAHMDAVSPESFHIRFDVDNIDADGFVGLNGVDNVGYDHSGLTDAESLAIVIAHEMMHAKHQAVWNDAVNETGSLLGAVEWLADNGYSPDFALIFVNITLDGAGNPVANYHDGETISQNMHDYMQQNNQDVFDAVLEEFRNDVEAMQNYVSDLADEFAQKSNQLNNWNPEPEEAQDYAILQQEVENLEAQIDYIQENYSWMFD